jgi:hypothetical protein
LRTDLKRLQRDSESGGRAAARGSGSGPAAQSSKWASRRFLIGVALAAIAAIAAVCSQQAAGSSLIHPLPARERQLTHNTSENRLVGADLSPDGRYLAYSDPGGLHLLVIDTGETR